MDTIEGNVIVFTGDSSRLGEAAVRLLFNEGAVVIVAVRRVDRINEIVFRPTAQAL